MSDFKVRWGRETLTWDTIPKVLAGPGEYDISEKLEGPLRHMSWPEAFKELNKAQKRGETHVLYAEWQKKYGGEQQLSANIVVPKLMDLYREDDVGPFGKPFATIQVIIGNPRDAARIGRIHVKKQPNFTTGLYSSIISTTDNELWKEQRSHLLPAFLPKMSLEQIVPVSAARARVCGNRLQKLSENFTKPVDMNDFFLFETQAQLQLALFGEDQEFMEETNANFRDSMAGKIEPKYARTFCKALSGRFHRDTNTGPQDPAGVAAGQCPAVHGPLANRLATMSSDPNFEGLENKNLMEQGNALIFAFAGHDTTGHTMTWMLYELSKHPEVMQRLRKEVDGFFQELGDREPTYADLKKLPFMTRCIGETLRLWPAVANGTFREIQFDDVITGPNGESVPIKKGTFVQIVNWSRHRNPQLWGDDVLEFNPDRKFAGSELWDDQVFAAYNPATERFSPFTFPPRGCIGMNFAHMESRLIMAHLVHNFDFELTENFKNADPNAFLGCNYGTLAPRNMDAPEWVEGFPGWALKRRVPTGMNFHVVPRKQRAKL